MPIITCQYCSKQVEAERKSRKYCSALCGSRARTKLPKERTCIECGIAFPVVTNADSRRQYCSQRCAKRHYGKPLEVSAFAHSGNAFTVKTCPQCKQTFETRNKAKIFCSKACYMRSYKGYPRERTCRKCGASFKVETQADANRQYCSQECFQSANKRRINDWHAQHPAEMKQYREDQLQRDPDVWRRKQDQERAIILDLLGGKCIVCGVTNPNWLHVDYIPTTRNKPHRHPRHIAYIRKHKEDFRLLCANHHYELTLTGMIEGTDMVQ